MKVKTFYATHPNYIEEDINKWLDGKENRYIHDIKYTGCGGGNAPAAFESWSALIYYNELGD